ncbi:MAG TPA: hypothetical protein VFS25_05310 [Chitinophaga sp.]|uniref:hypothetical protein n=1 Tax=Chitinophaga sp. TaxID=1869181 RepID=UPI002DB65284|nr:hypothetical protein [Chitinophaga sp.]HEU4552226.1 hypothetical protein [Chitinophaga sp.]
MKKIRIMLAAIVVLGSVGGALAFKAKNYSPFQYCYRTQTSGICTTSFSTEGVANGIGAGTYYFTTTTDASKCTNLQCTTRATQIVVE